MKRIITIDQDQCNGCGLCVTACHEGAIGIQEGKAVLLQTEQCDGLGNCLPVCPVGAIRMETTQSPGQWPIQLKLVPIAAPYFTNAHLLVSADCCAYTYTHFHRDFIDNRITLIGCPKLDNTAYHEKLTAIFSAHPIASITVVRMEVPCCGGLEYAVTSALHNSGKKIPCQITVLSIEGTIIDKKNSTENIPC
ncbi:MAG: 4Fe-4S binding protein [Treponema sp.]|jgi:ferredoxin|nr:4Fe-4S binding protein [Treponema sp.]